MDLEASLIKRKFESARTLMQEATFYSWAVPLFENATPYATSSKLIF